jgi:hypothetical protein
MDYFSFIALYLVNDVPFILAFNTELCNNLEVVYFYRGRNLIPFSKKNIALQKANTTTSSCLFNFLPIPLVHVLNIDTFK